MKYSRPLVFFLLVAAVLFFAIRPAEARDEWIQVKSKNFYLIGNASEKDIRKVATRLEQFRETFRQLFGRVSFTSSIQTNVIVFKSDSYYKTFKPKRADGKIDNFVAGYFQSGEDVNYITLSTEGEDAQTYSVIFHEYVHFIVNTNFGKSEVPPWFNEGLAEYYEMFAIEEDQKVKLGLPNGRHLTMLQQTKLIPLSQLFNISNYQLHQTGNHSRSIFYAQSWALIHYLIQSGKSDALNKFLMAILNGSTPEKAFQEAFQTTYGQMENDLRKYVGQSRYHYNEITFKNKLVFDSEMQALPLDDAASNAYLGDLLYHTNRADDAEAYLLASLKLKPEMSMANTTLGMVKMKQRKFDEAKQQLEKAIAGDQKNHFAFYRYAYLLSREGRDEFGYVQAFPSETAAKIRDALRKAIAINPAFTESYELLAFVDLVNNEELDDAVALLQKALKYQPGNQRYALRIAEIYLRQNKFAEANAIAERIARTADEPDLRQRAENLNSTLRQMQEFSERRAAAEKRSGEATANTGTPVLRRRNERPMTEEEIAKAQAEANLRSINRELRNLADGETRLIGRIQKIDCRKRPIAYTIKTPAETFTLTSADFESLTLNTFVEAANNAQIGCDAKLAAINAVITYKPGTVAKAVSRGEIIAVEFVADDFRIMTAAELSQPPPQFVEAVNAAPETIGTGSQTSATSPNLEQMRRDAMMRGLKGALRQPAEGEKRELGYLDRIECTNKGTFFHMRTGMLTLRLLNTSPQSLQIRLFTPDLEGLQLGCTLKPVEFPAVFIYKPTPDAKAKTAGEIISIDFVPKNFTLD